MLIKTKSLAKPEHSHASHISFLAFIILVVVLCSQTKEYIIKHLVHIALGKKVTTEREEKQNFRDEKKHDDN